MTEWELFVARMMFLGSMLVVALFARGLVELGWYACKRLTRRQDSPALVRREDEA